MIKLFCKAAVVLSLATLFGCSSTPSVEKMQADVASYSLPKAAVADKGLVYVVRPSNVGMLVRFNVFLDDKEADSEMGYNRGNQYIYFFVTPGKHVEMGFAVARNSLKVLSDLEGRYLVKDASLGTLVKENK
jgi:hypothetical protein